MIILSANKSNDNRIAWIELMNCIIILHIVFIVPGFNEHIKELHCEARSQYLTWRNAGRPRTGESHSDMRVSRLRFKYAFRQCRANEDMMRADALAHSLKSKDSTSFWKDVRKMANSKISLASKLEIPLVVLKLRICGKPTILNCSTVFMIQARKAWFPNILMQYRLNL